MCGNNDDGVSNEVCAESVISVEPAKESNEQEEGFLEGAEREPVIGSAIAPTGRITSRGEDVGRRVRSIMGIL